MNREDSDYIQSSIGYRFKNLKLLHQAFTRKSYSAEHPEALDNEVLEFYGDEVLDFFVTKMMYHDFSKIEDGRFVSQKSEGELSKLRSFFVSKETLALCSLNAGFHKLLYMGKGDIQKEVQNSHSVNEDLFEAIVGAVAVDSNWDLKVLETVCATMLKMISRNSYLCKMVLDKSRELGFGSPIYTPLTFEHQLFSQFGRYDLWELRIGCQPDTNYVNPATGLCLFQLKIGEHCFQGEGINPYNAKLDTEEKALKFLFQEERRQKIGELDFSNPVSQLHELEQKRIILKPIYQFNEYHDSDGNPIWRCAISLEGTGQKFVAEGASKKEVKQAAALELLNFLAKSDFEESKAWEPPIIWSGYARFLSDEQKSELETHLKRF